MKKMIAASLLCFAGATLALAEEVSVPAPAQEEQVIVDTGGSLHYVPKSQVQQYNAQKPVQSAPMQAPANGAQQPAQSAPMQAPANGAQQPAQSASMQAPANTAEPAPPAVPSQPPPQLPQGVALTPEQAKMLTDDQKKLLNSVVNPTVPTPNQ